MAARIALVGQRLTTELPKLVKAGQQFTVPRLQTFMKYARVELAPPSTSDLPQIQKGFNNLVIGAKTQAWRQLSVREATLNAMIAFEVACWFFVGEVIGKRCLIGYQIDGATHLAEGI